MSVVAAAVIGSTVVGGYVSYKGGKAASEAAAQGADSAAQAQIYSTDRQIQEIQRQFNYQTRTLQPRLDAQGAGSDAFRALTGTLPELADVRAQLEASEQQERNTFQQFEASGSRQQELRDQIAAIEAEEYSGITGGGPFGINRGLRREWEQDKQARIADLQGQLDQEVARFDTLNSQLQAYGDESKGYREDIQAIERAQPFLEGGAYREGPGGSFFDPNLDPTRLQDTETLTGTVQNNLQAGTSAEADPFRNYIQDNQIAAGTPAESFMVQRADQVRAAGPTLEGDVLRSDVAGRSLAQGAAGRELTGSVAGRRIADGAAGTGVYGDEFTESPGYSFMVEEMNRSLDRRNSAGGNYGGRAIMEAQRRAQGLAAGEYYNWAAGRERDLGRLGQAEAMDIGRIDQAEFSDRAALMGAEATDAARLDMAAQNYVARQTEDVRRGDMALSEWERQRIMDQGRDDAAYENYLRRRQGDATRLDNAAMNVDRLQGIDRQRVDQSYYNFLNAQAGVAGFGNAAGEAVAASGNAGNQIANAYANQGSTLANIYNTAGQNEANIRAGTAANINNALVSGASNWMLYNALV